MFDMDAATLFVHNVSVFHGFRKNIFGVLRNKVLERHWIFNFIQVIDISGWLSLLQFLSVTLQVMEILPGCKKSWSTPAFKSGRHLWIEFLRRDYFLFIHTQWSTMLTNLGFDSKWDLGIIKNPFCFNMI